MSNDKKTLNEYSVEPDDIEDPYAKEFKLTSTTSTDKKISDTPRQRTFHSKRAPLNADELVDVPTRKRKFSHAETSGVVISTVMLLYSLAELDKPLFFLSTALLTFLLRPIIGALFGKHSQAVQNALHSFSVVLFIGAMIMLFM